jgi:predicted nucleic acid-binding protein
VTFVVDASVALKWFLADEPLATEAFSLVRDETVLIAPDILIAEVCDAAWRLSRLGRIGQAELTEIATIVPRFFAELVGAAALASAATIMARQLDHPVYDCLYVTLAETRQLRLITADGRLLDKLRGTKWAASAVSLADYPSR